MITPARFRKALGNFCTGVTVVTARREEEPVGFACQSFAALSLDPPLVLFCPGRDSRTWPHIETFGHFCVNVLSHAQQKVFATFGTAGADKFSCVPWVPAPSGAPILAGVLTWLDCVIENVHEAGDHYVVVGRVTTLGDQRDERPLLFHRGQYTSTEPPMSPPEPWLTWSHPDDWI